MLDLRLETFGLLYEWLERLCSECGLPIGADVSLLGGGGTAASERHVRQSGLLGDSTTRSYGGTKARLTHPSPPRALERTACTHSYSCRLLGGILYNIV